MSWANLNKKLQHGVEGVWRPNKTDNQPSSVLWLERKINFLNSCKPMNFLGVKRNESFLCFELDSSSWESIVLEIRQALQSICFQFLEGEPKRFFIILLIHGPRHVSFFYWQDFIQCKPKFLVAFVLMQTSRTF